MRVLHEMAIDAVHPFFEVNVHQMNRRAVAIGRVRLLPILPILLLDEFGDLDREDVRQRMQQFALTLKTERSSDATVTVYGGLSSSVNDVIRMANWPLYVLLEAGIARERILLVNGGYREEPLTELWVVEKDMAIITNCRMLQHITKPVQQLPMCIGIKECSSCTAMQNILMYLKRYCTTD